MRGRMGIITSLAMALLIFCGLMWATGARADLPAEAPSLVVDETTHHLGDQTIVFFDVPDPEGTVYTTTFTLSASAVQDSFLRLETYNVQLANTVQLNGIEIGPLPGTWWIGWQPVALSVPAAALQEGENTLRIASGQFAQWHLFEGWYDDVMFRHIELLASQTPFSDQFDGSSLNPRWDWVDLLGDSSYSLTDKPGSLTVNVPGSTEWGKGHDLFWLTNFNAPRLLQPIRGDFLMETKLSADLQCNYQAAGLLAWQDTWHHVRLERNVWWGGSVFGGVRAVWGPQWTFRPTGATELYLRLSRVGDTFVGWYQEEGASGWTVLGQATGSFSDTLLAGLAVYNQGCAQSTSSEFGYFYISQVVPPILTTPCGTTNQAQPVIRGLATKGAQVRLYADGTQAATTTVTPEGTFAVSPTVALSPGSHTLTATATSGGEESSPSPDLNLTVAPDETIDLIGVTITHAPLWGDSPPITDALRNRDGCAACDGTGFSVWVPGSQPLTVSVPVSGTDVTSVKVRIGDVSYLLDDTDGDGVYEGTFTPPAVRGAASLEFIVYRAGGLVVEYSCGEIIIDPYGIVYDAAAGPSEPISGAVVTLYRQDPATQVWQVWSPTDGQENPQTTGGDGRYAFDVPEGMYYITVEAADYMSFASQPIGVSAATGPVELLVPLDRTKTVKVYLPVVTR